MLREPHIEGRNAHATLFEIYFKDPFLAYVYIASIPFFMALYQAFRVLGYVRQNQTFSQTTVKALRTIKYCAIAIVGFVVVSVVFVIFGVGMPAWRYFGIQEIRHAQEAIALEVVCPASSRRSISLIFTTAPSCSRRKQVPISARLKNTYSGSINLF
jgi:hypothetical protein